jgi:hypothetical protein
LIVESKAGGSVKNSSRQRLRVLGVSIAGLLATTSAEAHDPGATGNSGGAGAIHVITATPLAKGETVAGIVVEYISLDELSDATLISAGEEAVAEGEELHVHSLKTIVSPSLNLAYGVTEDLTVAFRLPYVVRTDIRAAEYNGTDVEAELHGDSDGIGDLTTLAQWRFFNDTASRTEAALLLGVRRRPARRMKRTMRVSPLMPSSNRGPVHGTDCSGSHSLSGMAFGASMPAGFIHSRATASKIPILATGSTTA